ncbi:PH domain-containing protein [Hallella absiana]|uniref:PH domain-containing protein n=1 Tax=Hallella absiana TaxID=2925336 RepID=UPI0021C83E67|nr:PH domain-containing protein [Hallella absiana]
MNKVYPSKKDIFVFIIICLIASLASSINAAMESGTLMSWSCTLLIVLVWLALFLLIYPTKYIIDGDNLLIRCGFQRKRISISQIIYVRRSHNLLASPALSVDRLEIVFKGKNTDSILISPRNRIDFVEDLKAINPDIDISKAL